VVWPTAMKPTAQASGRSTSASPVTSSTSGQVSPSNRKSTCMPMATKNTAPNMSRTPSNVRSTSALWRVLPTIAPRMKAPSASE
jgi:hypothetical protein